jgi:S1-C subfamily serine protease
MKSICKIDWSVIFCLIYFWCLLNVAINGEKVTDTEELRKYLYTKLFVGDKVTIEYYRNGKLNTEVTLTSNQAND